MGRPSTTINSGQLNEGAVKWRGSGHTSRFVGAAPKHGDVSQTVETLACEAGLVGSIPTHHPNAP